MFLTYLNSKGLLLLSAPTSLSQALSGTIAASWAWCLIRGLKVGVVIAYQRSIKVFVAGNLNDGKRCATGEKYLCQSMERPGLHQLGLCQGGRQPHAYMVARMRMPRPSRAGLCLTHLISKLVQV